MSFWGGWGSSQQQRVRWREPAGWAGVRSPLSVTAGVADIHGLIMLFLCIFGFSDNQCLPKPQCWEARGEKEREEGLLWSHSPRIRACCTATQHLLTHMELPGELCPCHPLSPVGGRPCAPRGPAPCPACLTPLGVALRQRHTGCRRLEEPNMRKREPPYLVVAVPLRCFLSTQRNVITSNF